MRKIDTPLTVDGKGHKNTQSKRGKMFGYQVLGFGSGGEAVTPVDADYLVIAGGGTGGNWPGGGGGAGGYRTSFPGGTKLTLDTKEVTITVGSGGAGPTGPQPDPEDGRGQVSSIGYSSTFHFQNHQLLKDRLQNPNKAQSRQPRQNE